VGIHGADYKSLIYKHECDYVWADFKVLINEHECDYAWVKMRYWRMNMLEVIV